MPAPSPRPRPDAHARARCRRLGRPCRGTRCRVLLPAAGGPVAVHVPVAPCRLPRGPRAGPRSRGRGEGEDGDACGEAGAEGCASDAHGDLLGGARGVGRVGAVLPLTHHRSRALQRPCGRCGDRVEMSARRGRRAPHPARCGQDGRRAHGAGRRGRTRHPRPAAPLSGARRPRRADRRRPAPRRCGCWRTAARPGAARPRACPDIDGFDVLRGRAPPCSVPVIALTARSSRGGPDPRSRARRRRLRHQAVQPAGGGAARGGRARPSTVRRLGVRRGDDLRRRSTRRSTRPATRRRLDGADLDLTPTEWGVLGRAGRLARPGVLPRRAGQPGARLRVRRLRAHHRLAREEPAPQARRRRRRWSSRRCSASATGWG